MTDLRIGASLGVFPRRNDALQFAHSESDVEAIVTTRDGEFEVFPLNRSGNRSSQLDAAARTNPRVIMSSNFIPTCTDFVIQGPGGKRTSIENHDIATFIRREQAKPGFFNKPPVEQVGFWETGRAFADMYGGTGPNELAVLRQLARAIRENIQDRDSASTERLDTLVHAYVSTSEAQDLSTLHNVLDKAKSRDITQNDMELASAAICRSYSAEHIALAKSIESAVARILGTNPHADWFSRYSMVVREFAKPLQGASLRDGQYENPTAMMTFGQNDFLSVTRQDTARCGAASLVAASLVFGPEALESLANHFGVVVDTVQPSAGPLHLLMEQIYMQTRIAIPDDGTTIPGLSENQVNRLFSQLFSHSPRPRLVHTSEFNEGDATVLLLAIGGSANEHAVLMFRDPKTNRMGIYEPEVFGEAARIFTSNREKERYVEEHPLHGYPGQIMIVASV